MAKKILGFLIPVLVGVLTLTGCGRKVDIFKTNCRTEELMAEGIVGDYTLLFLTDYHMTSTEQSDNEAVIHNAQARKEMFQNEQGENPEDNWGTFIAYANQEKVDGVLLGGDIIDFPSEANVRLLEEGLRELEMPYVYTIGNHDWTYPWEYMTDQGREQYLSELYPFMKGDTAIQSYDFGEFYVVAVDDCANQINETVLTEYKAILAEGKPVLLMLHVPLMTESLLSEAVKIWSSPVVLGGGNGGGIYPNETSTKFLELTSAKDSPVFGVISGHVHFFNRDTIKGDKNIPQIVGDAGFKSKTLMIHITGSK